MKTLALAFVGLVALGTDAFAHSVRNSDGSLRVHEHHAAQTSRENVRNVSASLPVSEDCSAVTWPDIPERCIIRDVPRAVASVQMKGEATLVTEVAASSEVAPKGARVTVALALSRSTD